MMFKLIFLSSCWKITRISPSLVSFQVRIHFFARFIGDIFSAARLMPSVNKSKKMTIDPTKDWKPLVLEYTDEMEYNNSHGMHNNDPNYEGRILCDIDYIYDKETITAHHPVTVQAKATVPASNAAASAAGSQATPARKNSVSSVDSAASRSGVKDRKSVV